ncbi:MAG TPA: DUF4926 domain-containing protein [Ignavibacteria bacterium]|nr:DUF4926 domain-containing protein [Ignavibacteria bacterium]
MNSKFKILDVVALLKDMPEKNLIMGQVGTIVETLGENVHEVEFTGKHGDTIALAAVDSENLLLLHYEFETA